MNNLIERIIQNLSENHGSVSETRRKIKDLTVHLITLREHINVFQTNNLALEKQHRDAMNYHDQILSPILNNLNIRKNEISSIKNNIDTLQNDLTRVDECRGNCDENFIRRVLQEINLELDRNKVDVEGLNNVLTETDIQMRNFMTTDDEIISEFKRVLTELNKLNALGVTSPPFHPIQLVRASLNEQLDTLNTKITELENLKNDFLTRKNATINAMRQSHSNKINSFDNFTRFVLDNSRRIINIRPSLNTITNLIVTQLVNLRNLQNNSFLTIERNIEEFNNFRVSSVFTSEFKDYIFLIFVVFLIFALDCFIPN